MEGGEGDITVPIPVFLIEHPKGRALFDTGLQRGIEKIIMAGMVANPWIEADHALRR